MIWLTVKEFENFSLLIQNPKRVFTYEVLIDLVWKEDCSYYSRKAVNNHISNLRRKIKVALDVQDMKKASMASAINLKSEECHHGLKRPWWCFFCENTYKNTLKNVTTK